FMVVYPSFSLFAFVAPQAHADNHAQAAETTKPTIIAFHSDTCGKCKILGPKMTEAMSLLNDEKFNTVKFDYTNRDTIASSQTLAAEKGLTEIQKSYGAKTGFGVIVDGNGVEIAKISADDSVEAIAMKLIQAISA
ncbi:MAG: thioredoxin domain-containing protein, partial [Pseudomonadota bacterium]